MIGTTKTLTTTPDQTTIDMPSVTPRQQQARIQSVRNRPPDFIGKLELAHHLGCHIGSLGDWIADGKIPPPWSRPGQKHPVWLRSHYETFKQSGEWPKAAFHDRAV